MSAAEFEPEPVPLDRDQAGRLKVSGTRISLDVLIADFKQGKSPESMHESYPSVPLADVYAIFSYYLRHRAAVEAYLVEQDSEAAAIQARIEDADPAYGLRATLLARLDS